MGPAGLAQVAFSFGLRFARLGSGQRTFMSSAVAADSQPPAPAIRARMQRPKSLGENVQFAAPSAEQHPPEGAGAPAWAPETASLRNDLQAQRCGAHSINGLHDRLESGARAPCVRPYVPYRTTRL
jgi:hypothetical protein